jgi:hypothetical protein
MSSRNKILIGTAALLLIVVLVIVSLIRASSDIGTKRQLSDGSTLLLQQVTFTDQSFMYTHHGTGSDWKGKMMAHLNRLLPEKLQRWQSMGSFGMGGNGETNLYVVTVNQGPSNGSWNSKINRLQIGDEQGDFYDACWGASTIGFPGETAHGWCPQAFPRRSKYLLLRLLAIANDGTWTNSAEFKAPNPAFRNLTQWIAEPWPITKTNGPLTITLTNFESGAKLKGNRGKGTADVAARLTRWNFDFMEDGAATKDWRIQKLTIRDATGNKWSPYLDLDGTADFTWAKGGTVEMFGALWPGEDAWKMDVEAVRTRGFKDDETWTTEVTLPARGAVDAHTNSWTRDNVTVKLASLASPNTDHPGDMKWVAKWWGEKMNETYSLCVAVKPGLRGHRVMLLSARDQDGNKVKIVQHTSQDGGLQAVFFRPDKDAKTVQFTFALPKSRTVQFVAKPRQVAR